MSLLQIPNFLFGAGGIILIEQLLYPLFDVITVKNVNYTGSSRHRRLNLVLLIKQN